MDKVAISVILPVYNAENFLAEAIGSILDQTFKNFELIIINDGSTDSSESIVNAFKDTRIIYIKNEKNSGLISSLNKAIEVARGSYLARMDADDIALPDRLELQYNAFVNNENRVVVSSDHFLLKDDKLSYSKNYNKSDELKSVLLFSPCFAHPTVMMKNIFSEKKLWYNEKFQHAEDYKLWIDLSEYGEFYNVDKPLLKYRSHPNQVSILNNEIQKHKSEELRRSYLKKLGFIFSEQDLVTHNTIGNNVFITSMFELQSIEKWLLSLLNQNEKLNMFDKVDFETVINKFWYDSCGYNNLGMRGFRYYFNSKISKKSKTDLSQKIKLFVKCLVRKFK